MDEYNLFPNAMLLGDYAYPLRQWLITPLHHDPDNQVESRYNRRLMATRQVTERALGILQETFSCLNYLRLNPTYAGSVVKCCATLCNFARDEGDAIVVPVIEEAVQLEENNVGPHKYLEVVENEVQYVGGRER
ncbi:hypothetical protein PR048_011709 [Dryococelus australis]|uniref:DDE Tnp4 domain-containing protein n=1 Tax=Dryococelus australis TaxID=614101 RepID=A0ABQ9HMA7_9NEOP|nr:hypothetical protein PR048_011709 [Dryococelus australis]